jgi:hypothetical protein
VGGDTLSTKMVTQDETITDKRTLTNIDYFVDGGFSLMAVVVPISMGEVLIWVAAAPGTPVNIKEEAEWRGHTGYAPNIPTFGVKLVKNCKTTEAMGIMRPVEGDLIAKKWGMCPLIQVQTHLKS